MGIDRMHGCDDGVVKKLMTLFFDTNDRCDPLESIRIENVLFYYSVPILEGVMRADYFENYMSCNMGCNTCYEYENINGQLLKLIHGTWHIDTQIANSQYEFIKMNRLIGLLSEGNIRNFCLRRKRQVKITEQLQERCYR
ncbi:hypothetical protein PV325_011548, partial [Microctonus aethiopoides]